jgi:hypothetical protein
MSAEQKNLPIPNAPEEVWATVKQCPRYEVSTFGRIRNAKKGTVRAPYLNSCGYERLRIQKKGDNVRFMIHRLVAEAFIPNDEEKELIDHIDGDRTNNRVENLRWCTHSENCLNRKPRKDQVLTKYRNIVKNGKHYRYRVCVNGMIHKGKNWPTEDEAHTEFQQKCGELSPFIQVEEKRKTLVVQLETLA